MIDFENLSDANNKGRNLANTGLHPNDKELINIVVRRVPMRSEYIELEGLRSIGNSFSPKNAMSFEVVNIGTVSVIFDGVTLQPITGSVNYNGIYGFDNGKLWCSVFSNNYHYVFNAQEIKTQGNNADPRILIKKVIIGSV